MGVFKKKMSKLIKYIWLLALVFVLASCTKDEALTDPSHCGTSQVDNRELVVDETGGDLDNSGNSEVSDDVDSEDLDGDGITDDEDDEDDDDGSNK